MVKDVTAFRERFNAYKNGKSVSEIYDAGLPRYAGGKPGLTKAQQNALDELYEWGSANGLDITAISGIGGNGIQESSLDSEAVSKSGYAGLWQNNKNLQAAIIDRYGDHSKKSQLAYAKAWINGEDWVRKGKYAAHTAMGSGKFKKSGYKTAEEASDAWMKQYERPVILDANGKIIGYQEQGKRRTYSKLAYDYLNNKYGRPILKPVAQTPITAAPDAVAVRPTIPAEQTVPAYDPTISPYISGKPMVKLRPRIELPNLMQLIEDSEWEPPFSYTDSKLPGYKNGKIYIKPANRGKFTALKKRTGHSASWFKENGTPAQKKMAVFALNAKKWHHADGKLPEYGGGLTPVAMPAQAAQNNNVVNGIMSYIPFVGTAMDGNDLIQGDTRAAIPFLIGTVADTVGGRSLYKAYQARKIFMDAVKQKLSTSQIYPLMIQANDKMNKALAGAAAYASDWYENTLQNLRK